jgi:hypothetical protein
LLTVALDGGEFLVSWLCFILGEKPPPPIAKENQHRKFVYISHNMCKK